MTAAAAAPLSTSTTAGTSRPVPTHAGGRISHAGSRIPHGWVSASATTIAATSIAPVTTLGPTNPGPAAGDPSGTPIITPLTQSTFSAR